jgi:hypothetical protein
LMQTLITNLNRDDMLGKVMLCVHVRVQELVSDKKCLVCLLIGMRHACVWP